jgi:hypothetical protein
MSLSVNTQHLLATAKVFDQLAADVDTLPKLTADPVATALTGCPVGDALAHSDTAGAHVKDVLKGRFQEISSLLSYTANEYLVTDLANCESLQLDAADRLDAIGDLNDGNANPGK